MVARRDTLRMTLLYWACFLSALVSLVWVAYTIAGLRQDLKEANSARNALVEQVKALGENPVVGPEGKAGPVGPAGKDGTNGRDGWNGSNGRDGADGINGSNGADGQAGRDGSDGQAGTNGKDGSKGDPGPTGPQGPRGSDGPAGPRGDVGPQGDPGPTCPTGYSATIANVFVRESDSPTAVGSYREVAICTKDG